MYFAYGSNLSIRRLQQRVPSASLVCVAYLRKHQLRFHKRNKDGSSKADCYESKDKSHHVWGAVFSIDKNERVLLDHAEGLGLGYDVKTVSVEVEIGGNIRDIDSAKGTANSLEAFTYVATDTVKGWLPYGWYLQHVVTGASEVGLPAEYIEMLSLHDTKADPDESRNQHELSIYF